MKFAGIVAAVTLLTTTAMAQRLPPSPGPAPGYEDRVPQASFDCGSTEPQPMGDNITMQAIFSPFMWEDPKRPDIGRQNVCPYPQGCMLFTLPSGQRVAVGGICRVTVLEGAPLEQAMQKKLQDIGCRTILWCDDARKNASACKSKKWNYDGQCVR